MTLEAGKFYLVGALVAGPHGFYELYTTVETPVSFGRAASLYSASVTTLPATVDRSAAVLTYFYQYEQRLTTTKP